MNDLYKEARADVRFFSGLMFGQLTVFLATSGWLIKIFFDNSGFPRILIAQTGIVVTIAFFVINIRARDWVEASRQQTKENSAPKLKRRGNISATYATYFLYGYAVAAWVLLFIISVVKVLKPF